MFLGITLSAVTVTKIEYSFWDEKDIVRKDYADFVQYGKSYSISMELIKYK